MAETNSDLLGLAAKANRIAIRLSRENELSRVPGRLTRDPHDFDALARSIVHETKKDSALAEYFANGPGLVQLHLAIAQVSHLYWEDLWNDAHPNQFGQAWSHDDFQLMPVWREKVRELIEECHQGWLLTLDGPEGYKEALMAADSSDGAADWLVDWLSMVQSEQEV